MRSATRSRNSRSAGVARAKTWLKRSRAVSGLTSSRYSISPSAVANGETSVVVSALGNVAVITVPVQSKRQLGPAPDAHEHAPRHGAGRLVV